MENRTLQKTGGSSLTVTLPKEWVNRHMLHEKDKVAITNQVSGALLIKIVPKQSSIESPKLDIQDKTLYMITRETLALYVSGVDEIKFTANPITQQQRSHIRRIVHVLMGFEIVDESANSLLIRNILDVSKLTISNTIDNMFMVTHSMLSDAVNAAIDNTNTAAQDIVDRDLEIDKMHLMIKRQFQACLNDKISEEEINMDRADLGHYHTIALQLERIADHAAKIAETVPARTSAIPEVSKEVYSNLLNKLLVILESTKEISHTSDEKAAHNILDRNNELESVIENLRFEPRANASSRVILDDSLDRVRGYLMNIAEEAIDRSVRRKSIRASQN